jgi:hypothetical protein
LNSSGSETENKCYLCEGGCKTCVNSVSECVTCKATYYKHQTLPQCDVSCEEGYFKDSVNW